MKINLTSSTTLVMLLALALLSCSTKDSLSPREYPRLDTEEVTSINSSGATFSATIKTLGVAPITDHGFVWSNQPYVYVEYSSRISLGAKQEAGSFTATGTFAMEADKMHYVRAYTRSGEYVVYGPVVSFTSKGSMPPAITGFSPTSARNNEHITITGENFTQELNRLQVLFGSIPATIISATPEAIICIVPYNLQTSQVKITVTVADKNASSSNNFTLIK